MDLLKSHTALWAVLATNFTTDPKTRETFLRRSTSLDFFYEDLPALGKALDKGLATGRLDIVELPFRPKSKTDSRPLFLHEFFKLVFDNEGYVLDRPKKIQEIRQLTMMFYKFEMPIDADKQRLATLKFIVTDSCVKTHDWPDNLPAVRKHFRSILPGIPSDIRPHHSNGATFDHMDYVGRRLERKFYPLLYQEFGLSSFFPSHRSVERTECAASRRDPVIQTSRISFVPKDSRGPRVICIEPHEPMMAQKGIMQYLYDHIEVSSPAKGYINFTNQDTNRYLAQQGSIDGRIATIDLKDASDLVSWELIKLLTTHEWSMALRATRSSVVEIDSFKRNLKKFAPMGSALCFPIEAMLFWSICRTETEKVYVYGDDIIVDANVAQRCIAALETYGLKVNHDKTLTTGFFRESCGGEYYHGADISYIKCKSYDLQQFTALLNLFSVRYGDNFARTLAGWYEAHTRQVVYREPISNRERARPYVFYTDACSSSDVFFKHRWNLKLQRFEVRTLHETVRSIKRALQPGDDEMFYFDWLVSSFPANQPEDYHINREFDDDGRTAISRTFLDTDMSVSRQAKNPVTKFLWGVKTQS